MEAGISDHANGVNGGRFEAELPRGTWNLEEMCALLAASPSAAKRIDKGLILKALGEKVS
jgi:hypothetical protein